MDLREIKILGEQFILVDTKEKLTIADSFVVRQNKIGGGNGEAKLYVGQNNGENLDFFGNSKFQIRCFLLRQDLIKYLDETRPEYLAPMQAYQTPEQLPNLWDERRAKIEQLPNKIEFEAVDQDQIVGPRIYIKSNDFAYNLLRELSLPNITYISIVKLLNNSNQLEFYFRLFADYFGDIEHPYVIQKEKEKVRQIKNETKRDSVYRSRIGQGIYRKKLLSQCPFCPITMVSDERLLTASHIKPWAKSNEFEKTDPLNGFMLTPTFDLLFDRGFISFTNDKKAILSPFLGPMTYSKLGISHNKKYDLLPIEGREKYLDYHRTKIFKI